MKRFWKKLKGGDGSRSGGPTPEHGHGVPSTEPVLEAANGGASGENTESHQDSQPPSPPPVTAASVAPAGASGGHVAAGASVAAPEASETLDEAAAEGGEAGVPSPEESPPTSSERASPNKAAPVQQTVPSQSPPLFSSSPPRARSPDGAPAAGAAPSMQAGAAIPQGGDAGPWSTPPARTSRWQVDASRLSGARRALREGPTCSADSTTQSSSDSLASSAPGCFTEVTSSLDEEHSGAAPALCPSGPASSPSRGVGATCGEEAALEPEYSERSLEALVQAAAREREALASRAAAALAGVAQLDTVLRAAHVCASVQALSEEGPPQAPLEALLSLREEEQGPRRAALAAAWVEAALSGGLESPPLALPGARVPSPRPAPRAAAAWSSGVPNGSPLRGSPGHAPRRPGAVVTTPAPSRLQNRDEAMGQRAGVGRSEATGATLAGEGLTRSEEGGRVSAAAAMSKTGMILATELSQPFPHARPPSEGPPGKQDEPCFTGPLALAERHWASPKARSSGSGEAAVALEQAVREGSERQLVALVGRVLAPAHERPATADRSSYRGPATLPLALLHRAHQQLTEVAACGTDQALRAQAAAACDALVKHVSTQIIN